MRSLALSVAATMAFAFRLAPISEDGVWRAMINGRWPPVPPRVALKTLGPAAIHTSALERAA